jgi:hypothetical protein
VLKAEKVQKSILRDWKVFQSVLKTRVYVKAKTAEKDFKIAPYTENILSNAIRPQFVQKSEKNMLVLWDNLFIYLWFDFWKKNRKKNIFLHWDDK